MPPIKRVLVTGGAGYIGSNLVPKLLSSKYEVNVLDLFMYGSALQVFDDAACLGLRILKGDIRDLGAVRRALRGCHAVIHLACISNDPTYQLNEQWCEENDVGSMPGLLKEAKEAGVRRFIYASSSSVYGTKPDGEEVTEESKTEPKTTYSASKLACEGILKASGLPFTILRPATVCGYARRLRLDVVVNALTAWALGEGRIFVTGGGRQTRANLHIEDMTDLYRTLLEKPPEAVDGKTWNVGAANMTVMDIAELVAEICHAKEIVTKDETADDRSYRINSDRIAADIGFVPKRSVRQAIDSLLDAYLTGKIADILVTDKDGAKKINPRYINVEWLKANNIVPLKAA